MFRDNLHGDIVRIICGDDDDQPILIAIKFEYSCENIHNDSMPRLLLRFAIIK